MSGFRDFNVKWLNPKCVCADMYGDSNLPRRDDVVIIHKGDIFFAQLLLLGKIQMNGWHEFCYVRMYAPVYMDRLTHPTFGELYIQPTEKYG